MGDAADDSQHVGLVVRSDGHSLLIWSPNHDVVKASGCGLNSQWTVGTWIQYRAIADVSTPNHSCEIDKPTFMVYEISRVRSEGSFPLVDVRRENDNLQVEFSVSVTGPLRHLNANCVLAEDYFLGPILCQSNAELIQKSEDLDTTIELKVTFIEDFPDLARFVALAFRDESTELWTQLKNPVSKQESIPAEGTVKETLKMTKQTGENEHCNTMKAFGTMANPTQKEETDNEQDGPIKCLGTLSKAKLTADASDNEKGGTEKSMPSTSLRMPIHQSDKLRDSSSSLFSLHESDPYEEKDGFSNWKNEFGCDNGGSEQLENTSEPSQFDREEKIVAELSHYQKEHFEGPQRRKRSFGLIVEKMFDYATVYSKKFGLAILPCSRFSSLQQFDSVCVVGQWLLTVIVEVPDSDGLTFTHMCLPPFERKDQNNVQTLVNSEGKVEILLNCDFSVSNLKSLGHDQYVLSTELGEVLVSGTFIRQNGILENVSNVWVRYIGGRYFFWEIDMEAKLVTDSDDEIVFIHSDDEPTCSSVTKQLATVDFTNKEDEEPANAITAELASVFAANALCNEHQPKSIEKKSSDLHDGCEKENEQHNYGSHSGMGDEVENDKNEESILCNTSSTNQNSSEQQTQPLFSQDDFASIYNYARTFWRHLCKD